MKKVCLLSFTISLSTYFACHAAQLPNPSGSTANPPSHTLDNDFQAPGDSTAGGDSDTNDTPFGEGEWQEISSDEDLDSIMNTPSQQKPSKKPAVFLPPKFVPKIADPAEENLSESALQKPKKPSNNQANYLLPAAIGKKKPSVKKPEMSPLPKIVPKIEEPAEEKSPEIALQSSYEPSNDQANYLLPAAIGKKKPSVKKPEMSPPPKIVPKIEEPAEEKSPEIALQSSHEPSNDQANYLLPAAIGKKKPSVKKPEMSPPPKIVPKIEEPAEEKSPEIALQSSHEQPNNQASKPLVVATPDKALPVQKQNAASVLNSFMQSNRNMSQASVLEVQPTRKTVVELNSNIVEDIKEQTDTRNKAVSANMEMVNCMKQSMLALSNDTVKSKKSHAEKLKELMESFDSFLKVSKSVTDENIATQQKYLKSEKAIVKKNFNTVGQYLSNYHRARKEQVDLQYYELKKQLKISKKRFEAELRSVALAERKLYEKKKRDQKEKERQALQAYEEKNEELEHQLNAAKTDQAKEILKLEFEKLKQDEKDRRLSQAIQRKAMKTNLELSNAFAKADYESKEQMDALKRRTKKKLEEIKVKREQIVAELQNKKNEEENRLALIRLREENNSIINERKMQNKRIEEKALRKSLVGANKLFQDELKYAQQAVKKYNSHNIKYTKPYIDKKIGKVIPGEVTFTAKK